jgi:hypothetical protein
MSDDRWPRIEELYHAALAFLPEQRAAFLEEASGGDSEHQADGADTVIFGCPSGRRKLHPARGNLGQTGSLVSILTRKQRSLPNCRHRSP